MNRYKEPKDGEILDYVNEENYDSPEYGLIAKCLVFGFMFGVMVGYFWHFMAVR